MDNELVQLGRQLLQTYARGDYHGVSHIAQDYLTIAERHRNSHIYGTAIHQANTLLGLAELERGQTEVAAGYLLRSARTPGSRQIKAFGPSMLLALRLLERGQRRIVVRYLKMCRSLWTLSFGTLLRWQWQIQRGQTPNFGANLSYLVDYKSF